MPNQVSNASMFLFSEIPVIQVSLPHKATLETNIFKIFVHSNPNYKNILFKGPVLSNKDSFDEGEFRGKY